jgi:hypothetical protein
MSVFRAIAVPLLVLVAAAAPAAAQPTRFEISPYAGYRWGGELDASDNALFDRDVEVDDSETYGVRLNFALNQNFEIELLASHQPTQFTIGGDQLFGDERPLLGVDLETLHAGVLFQFGYGQLKPYGVMSLGMTRFDPEAGSSDDRWSGSFGGGVKLMVNRSLGFRFEGRWYWVDTGDDDYYDDCCGYYDDYSYGGLFQGEVTVGLIFAM